VTFQGFVDDVLARLVARHEPGTYVQLTEVVADLDVPWEWVGQAAKLLEYRLLAECLYSAHGTPYVRLTDYGRERARSLPPAEASAALERSARVA
jgi:hypothetical protein